MMSSPRPTMRPPPFPRSAHILPHHGSAPSSIFPSGTSAFVPHRPSSRGSAHNVQPRTIAGGTPFGGKRIPTLGLSSSATSSVAFDEGWRQHAQRQKQRQKLRQKRQITTIHTSTLYEPKTESFMEDVSIDIDTVTGRIVRLVQHDPDTEVITRAGDVDLRGKFVMPGLVDAHTHVFLHSYRERPMLAQMASESVVERTIRAANHVRAALFAGYTSLRDLGTEGMQSFDTDLRNSIKNGLTPGPRLFVATHPVASSASSDHRPPYTFDIGDGIAGIVAAVQRRAKAGADVIKVYCDTRKSSNEATASRAAFAPYASEFDNESAVTVPAFNYAELRALVNEARVNRIPVAAHATSAEAALNAVEAGVLSLEHGPIDADEELFHAMRQRGCVYVPTLAAVEALNPEVMLSMQRSVRLAYDVGVAIAAGGDTGVFAHGQGARELELLIDAGVPVGAVLSAATIHGYRACGGAWTGCEFGWLGEGCMADIIALDADPRIDSRAFRRMNFIMKEGQIWKLNGARTPLVFGPGELGFPGQDEAEMGWEVVEKPSWRD